MAKDSFKVKKSLSIKPVDPSTIVNPEIGDVIIDSNDNKLKTYDGSGFNEIATGAGGGSVEVNVNQVAHGFNVLDPIVHNGTEWTLAISNSDENVEQYVVVEVTDVDNFKAAKFGEYAITIPDKASYAGKTASYIGKSLLDQVGKNDRTIEKLDEFSYTFYLPSEVYASNLIKKLYFVAASDTTVLNYSIYELDLVNLETTLLFDDLPGISGIGTVEDFYYSEGTSRVYFYADDIDSSYATFSFDPSNPAGTISQVSELGIAYSRDFFHVDGFGLFFRQNGKLYNWDYVSPSPTIVFNDIEGSTSYNPTNLSLATNPNDSNDYLFFTAIVAGNQKMFYWDGVSATPTKAFDTVDTVANYSPSRVQSTSTSLYFLANDTSGRRLYSWDGVSATPTLDLTLVEGSTNYAIGDLFHDPLNDAVVFNGVSLIGPNDRAVYTRDSSSLSPYIDSYVQLQPRSDIIIEPSLSIGKRYFLSSEVAGQYSTEDGDQGFSSPLFYIEDQNTVHIEAYRPVEIVDKAEDTEVISVVRAAYSDLSDLIDSNGNFVGSIPVIEGNGSTLGTLSIPTSGNEAISSHLNSHKVFKWESAPNSQYDSFGSFFFIPNSHRGNSLTLGFDYRTERTTGSSVDEDYGLWVINETSSVVHYSNDSGVILSGSDINFDSTTGFNVSDVVYIRQTDNSVVVANITNVTPTTIQVDQNVDLPTFNATFMTGVLYVDTLSAADDDVTKNSTRLEVNFTCPSDCEKIVYFFQQLTNASDSFIFIDNIFVKNSELKTVLARGRAEEYRTSDALGYGSTATKVPYYKTTPDKNTISNLGTITNDSTDGFAFTATRRCKVHAQVSATFSAAEYIGWTLNSNPATAIGAVAEEEILAITRDSVAGEIDTVSCSVVLEAGDVIRPHTNAAVSLDANDLLHAVTLLIEPEVNDVVVVESTDSVISEWTDYTSVAAGSVISGTGGDPVFGTIVQNKARWRRVGQSMEIEIDFNQSAGGTNGTGNVLFNLPSGYQIDTDKIGTSTDLSVTVAAQESVVGTTYVTTSGSAQAIGQLMPYSATELKAIIQYANTSDTDSRVYPFSYASFSWANPIAVSCRISVPIAGWDANPKPLLALPTVTYGQDAEEFECQGFVGHGSTNTTIPYFGTVIRDTISNLGTIDHDNSTDGFSFTATKRCRVVANYAMYHSGAISIGWSLNSNQLTTSIGSITDSHRVGFVDIGASQPNQCMVNRILEPGDVLRPHTTGAGTAASAYHLQMTVEPEEGQVNQAAIIAQPVAYARFTDTDTAITLGSNTTVTLSELDGDIAAVGVTLSSNDFTLPAGKYEIDWCFSIWANGAGYALGSCQLYNVTDAVVVRDGTTAGGDGNNYGMFAPSLGSTLITITKSTTFRIRGNNKLNSGSHTLAIGDGGHTDEKGYVKITRKK